jgi:hypothetical protein
VLTIIIIQFNPIYLCAKLNSPETNYKVSTAKKMGRVRSKKVSENNILIKIKIINYKMTEYTTITINYCYLIITLLLIHLNTIIIIIIIISLAPA